MISLYNTLTKKKEEFKPINPPNVNMYICGPTVYDFFHIGNARTFVMADIIRRYLEYRGFNVKYVMNLTDVDDKIIKKANAEKVDTSEVTGKYIGAFMEDIGKLKIKKADVFPRATEHMDDIIKMVKSLVDKGYAYEVDGNVFYNVEKFDEYGKLSGKKIDELESGARIEINEEKKDPLDFALWKKAKKDEPYWESPWGKGRPGWHIECSAMSCKHLGETFDIHAGGNDLIFPHHENEIAQSEGANGKKFVNYWLHFGFLNINEEKMSKSLGNFFTARDVVSKYPAEAIRLFFAQANYGGPLNFTDELLTGAAKGLEKINNLAERINYELSNPDGKGNKPEFDFAKFEESFQKAMDDDFNSPQAVAVIFDFVKEINIVISNNEDLSSDFYKQVKEFLDKTAVGVLGILDFDSFKSSSSSIENDLIDLLIQIRLDARKDKNFKLSDRIRDDLNKLGIVLQDSKDKTTYKKTKK